MVDDRDSWRTPKPLFNWLNSRFKFNIDAAATKENKLCNRYIDEKKDTFTHVFKPSDRIFCNPPYSLDRYFAMHLYEQYELLGTESMLLLPVRCDRVWWNDLRTKKGVRIEFYTGRIHFSGSGKGAFMYNCNFIFGYKDVPTVDPIDAGKFNEGGKGSAKK